MQVKNNQDRNEDIELFKRAIEEGLYLKIEEIEEKLKDVDIKNGVSE